MKKPAWISVVGWVTLAYGLFVGASWIAASTQHWSGAPLQGLAVGTIMFWPPFGVWCIATIVHKLAAYHAKTAAVAMAEAFSQYRQGPAPCGSPGPDSLRCDLPAGHAGPHRNAMNGPQSIAEGIRQAQARGGDATLPGPRRVMTSPLNLTGTDKR